MSFMHGFTWFVHAHHQCGPLLDFCVNDSRSQWTVMHLHTYSRIRTYCTFHQSLHRLWNRPCCCLLPIEYFKSIHGPKAVFDFYKGSYPSSLFLYFAVSTSIYSKRYRWMEVDRSAGFLVQFTAGTQSLGKSGLSADHPSCNESFMWERSGPERPLSHSFCHNLFLFHSGHVHG